MATLVESGGVRSPGRSTGGEGRGAVEFRAQGRDGLVLGLGGHGRQLHGEGASGRAGTQAGVGLEQRLGKGADFLGLAGMRCEHGDGKGFGPVSDQVKCAAARFEEDFLSGGAGRCGWPQARFQSSLNRRNSRPSTYEPKFGKSAPSCATG